MKNEKMKNEIKRNRRRARMNCFCFFGRFFFLPLFGELEETSRDLSDLRFETKESWDVCPNSPESGKSEIFILGG